MKLVALISFLFWGVKGQMPPVTPYCPEPGAFDTNIRWELEEHSGVTYTNIADMIEFPNSGLAYTLERSPYYVANVALAERGVIHFTERHEFAHLRNHPSIAVFDFDNDCDLDIYVSNTLGAANSLFVNNLNPQDCHSGGIRDASSPTPSQVTGVTFEDKAVHLGIDMTNHFSSGVCVGDIDNDGNIDIIVLGRGRNLDIGDGNKNFLIRSKGGGQFYAPAVFDANDPRYSSELCSLGDVDNDGYLDLFIGTGAEYDRQGDQQSQDLAFLESTSDPNSLYINDQNGGFIDVSVSSGIRDIINDKSGCAESTWDGKPVITHHSAIIDIDGDGCMDIIHGDESVGNAVAPRGNVHVFMNDNKNCKNPIPTNKLHFTDNPVEGHDETSGLQARNSAIMGGAYGDLDCDGILDAGYTDAGSYAVSVAINVDIPGPDVIPFEINHATQWIFGRGDGHFRNPFPGSGREAQWANPFGFGIVLYDYDNDGDLDFLTHGGLEHADDAWQDNPSWIFSNQGCGSDGANPRVKGYLGPKFKVDNKLYGSGPDNAKYCKTDEGVYLSQFCNFHMRRVGRSLATGDLNNDGKYDIISTSGATFPLDRFPTVIPGIRQMGDPVFDPTAIYMRTWRDINDTHLEYKGEEVGKGDMWVEIDTGDNDNNFVKVLMKGSKGLGAPDGGLKKAKMNRDAIGTTLTFIPHGMRPVSIPVLAGDGHMATNSFEKIFGMKDATFGDLFIKFPGGVHNALFDLEEGNIYTIYELPCDTKNTKKSERQFFRCVERATDELVNENLISQELAEMMINSNVAAFLSNKA